MNRAKRKNPRQAPNDTATLQASADIEMIFEQLRHILGNDQTQAGNRPASEPTLEEIRPRRLAGRFKGKLVIGPEFFHPLTQEDIKELTGE